MKVLTCSFFILLTMAVMGQVNNETAFFSGNYNKDYIQKNKISQIEVNGYLNERRASKFVFEFDKRGLLIKETTFDTSGKKLTVFTFTYNERNDQIERKQTSYSSNKTNSTTFAKTYSGSKLVTEMSSELPFVTKHSYNDKGQRDQSETILGNDSNANKKIAYYSYDTKGRLISCKETLIKTSSQTSSDIGQTNYQYDASGNVIKVIRNDNSFNGNSQLIYNLKYNKTGLLVISTAKMPEDLGGMNIVDNYSYVFWK